MLKYFSELNCLSFKTLIENGLLVKFELIVSNCYFTLKRNYFKMHTYTVSVHKIKSEKGRGLKRSSTYFQQNKK